MAVLSLRMMDADRLLVERTREGDLEAFEEIVDRHRAVVYRVAARVAGREEADDVAQDAFLRAFHRLQGFRGDASFRAWLLQITHNAAVDHVTRRRDVPDAEQVERMTGAAPERDAARLPAERLEASERRDRLEYKLTGLRREHRVVLVLRDLEGLPYEEIAEITETPLGTVKGRLHRARAELIDLLRHNTYDWELPA